LFIPLSDFFPRSTISSMNKAVVSRPRVLLVIRAILISDSKILLIQRSRNDSHEPLKWEIPGGKLDKGQDVNSAAQRELIEEVGIFATPLSSLSFFDSDIDGSTKYKGLPYVRFVCLYKCETQKVRLSEEHEGFKWVTFDEALNEDITEFTRKGLLAWEKEMNKYL